ncbi:MAG: hypothetical protein V1921_07535 [Candidatus Altiarchaeota archaeon]
MVSKKGISTWKQKQEYQILAPETFEGKRVGSTLASDEKKLIGRKITVSLKDLTDDRAKQHIKVTFKIVSTSGSNAITKFDSFNIAIGYLKSRTRKGMKKVDYIMDLKVSDASIRIKTVVITDKRISKNQRSEIAKKMTDIFNKYSGLKLDEFVQLTLFGKLGTELYHNVKNICRISRVEVYEIKTL